MCGIAGIMALDSGRPPERIEVEAMIDRLHHRGPDEKGIFNGEGVALAHARLSIIDLTSGQQPIHSEERDVWVVFNGEIFNYLELRRTLEEQGHCFYTRSDTEVIVHLYEQHGERFVDHLNGQFAIALWDVRKRCLILARDRTGIRPLFYTETQGRFLFASEVKALFALPEVHRSIDPRALAEICTYWATLAPRTAFKGIQAVPPGHIMVVDNGVSRVKCYWDWSFPESLGDRRRSEADYAEELRSLLIDAVRLQLRSDVPVGAYLSGGLDSSIIASLVRNYSDSPLRTFSLTFDDAEFDESNYQEEMATFLGTEHTSLRCTRADIAAAFPRTIFHTESPIVRTAPTPLMLLSGHVRAAGYKVVLTGEGADEVFGGYDLFKEAKIRRFWARSPDSRLRPRILERLYPYLKNSPATGRAFTQAFFKEGIEFSEKAYFAHIPRWTTTGRIAQFFSDQLRESIGDWDPYAAILPTLPKDIMHWMPLGRDQYVEAHTLMSGYLLSSQGDRVAMANSIEGRVPFLDHRLIEFANQLPPQLKLHGLTEKYLLKKSMAGLLPATVLKRTKQPYRAPDSQSFFEAGKPVGYVEDLFSPAKISAAGYFDAVATGKLYRKCRNGKVIGFADNMAFVAILSTMLLHEQFVLGNAIDCG
jgi:asparagine synthase (glutamine-hydrolysing)